MSTSTFSEGGYQISFDDRWDVFKYDEHKYYKIVSGRSFSGVDIAGIYNETDVYFIELKNFYQHTNNGVIADYDNFLLEIREKYLDTLDLIQIIHKYHTRQWMYRRFYPIVERFPKLYRNWWLWTRMYQLCLDKQNVHFVLLIESTMDHGKIVSDINQALLDKSIGTMNILVSSYKMLDIPGVITAKSSS